MKSEQETRNKVSLAWYAFPILFSFVGGIFAYVMIRDRDEEMAKNVAIVGFLTIPFHILIGNAVYTYQMQASMPKPVQYVQPVPTPPMGFQRIPPDIPLNFVDSGKGPTNHTFNFHVGHSSNGTIRITAESRTPSSFTVLLCSYEDGPIEAINCSSNGATTEIHYFQVRHSYFFTVKAPEDCEWTIRVNALAWNFSDSGYGTNDHTYGFDVYSDGNRTIMITGTSKDPTAEFTVLLCSGSMDRPIERIDCDGNGITIKSHYFSTWTNYFFAVRAPADCKWTITVK